MGRAKLEIKYRENPKARRTTLSVRMKGLKKKAKELSALCGVDVLFTSFSPEIGKIESWPEEGSFDFQRITERYRHSRPAEMRSVPCSRSSFSPTSTQTEMEALEEKLSEIMERIHFLQASSGENLQPWQHGEKMVPFQKPHSHVQPSLTDFSDSLLSGINEDVNTLLQDFVPLLPSNVFPYHPLLSFPSDASLPSHASFNMASPDSVPPLSSPAEMVPSNCCPSLSECNGADLFTGADAYLNLEASPSAIVPHDVSCCPSPPPGAANLNVGSGSCEAGNDSYFSTSPNEDIFAYLQNDLSLNSPVMDHMNSFNWCGSYLDAIESPFNEVNFQFNESNENQLWGF